MHIPNPPAPAGRRITLDGRGGVAAPAETIDADGLFGGMHRVEHVDPPHLLITPATRSPARGTILIQPGGGYAFLAIRHEGTAIARWVNELGFDAAILHYRVNVGAETRRLALEDAQAALALIRTRGAEFGLNTAQVGIFGFSAGGHLAVRLAHETEGRGGPDFLILIYPAYLEEAGVLQPEVLPPPVPLFMYVAADDPYSPSALALAAVCRAEGRPCEFHLAERGAHGFGLTEDLPEAVRDWPDKVRAFLNHQSGGSLPLPHINP
jgi:acetyl esterase/lipase